MQARFLWIAGALLLAAASPGSFAQTLQTPPAPGSLASNANLRNPPATGMPNPAQIADLVLANRILAAEGVVDAYGHVSVRDERNPNHFLLAQHLPPAVITAGDIIEYDLDSKPARATTLVGYSERFIHGEIYKARPDVKAVVHFHAAELIPFSVTNVPLRPMIHMAGFLPQNIPVFEIRKFGLTDLLVQTNAAGHALAQTLGDKPTALMRAHGAVVVADSLHVVVGRAYYMTVNAKAQLQAMAIGGKDVVYLDKSEADTVAALDGFERAWTLWASQQKGK